MYSFSPIVRTKVHLTTLPSLLIVLMTFFNLVSLELFAQKSFSETKKKDFFNLVQTRNDENYPESFSSKLESTVVSFQFKNIPGDAIEIGKKPELYLKFKKGYAPLLITENVSAFYANFFTPYEAMIQKSGLFFGIDYYKEFKTFNNEFIFKIKKITEGYKVSVREREGLNGDYAEYHFYKDYRIFKAYFYEAKKKTGEVKFFYQEVKGKTLPKRLIILLENRKQGGMKEFFVDFVKYDFKSLDKSLF